MLERVLGRQDDVMVDFIDGFGHHRIEKPRVMSVLLALGRAGPQAARVDPLGLHGFG